MALYLRELREVLVTLGPEAKNSDNVPKGYPGRERPGRATEMKVGFIGKEAGWPPGHADIYKRLK